MVFLFNFKFDMNSVPTYSLHNKGLFDEPLVCNKSKFVINNFVIPDEQMPENPFDGSSRYNIYKLSIPNTVKSIKNYAFDNYLNLEKVDCYASTCIPKYCFNNCTNLKSVKIDNEKCNTICEGAFRKCEQLRFVYLYNIKYIHNRAFEYTTNLKYINLLNTLIDIGDNAFKDSGIKSINIPENVEYLGKNIFKNCKNLTEIKLSGYLRGKYENERTCRFDFKRFGLIPDEWKIKLYEEGLDFYYVKVGGENKIEYSI